MSDRRFPAISVSKSPYSPAPENYPGVREENADHYQRRGD
jgi:hypothetical protein